MGIVHVVGTCDTKASELLYAKVTGADGALDRLTKELIYIAVSTMNSATSMQIPVDPEFLQPGQ